METQNNNRIPVLGIGINAVSVPRAVEISKTYLSNDYFNFVLLAGIKLTLDSLESDSIRQFAEEADMILPADCNVERAVELESEQDYMREYLKGLLTELNEKKGQLCLLCECKEQAELIMERLDADYLDLKKAVVFYDSTEEEAIETMVNQINGYFPDLILPIVSLEKQQILILSHKNMLSGKLFVGSDCLENWLVPEDDATQGILKWVKDRLHIGQQEALESQFWQMFRAE